MTLFNHWLAETRQLQTEVYGFDFDAMTDEERKSYLATMTLALYSEVAELQAEFPWKTWARDEGIRGEAVGGEAVDALHFLANILLAVGWTDEKLEEKYLAKMQINRDRQARKGGYSTVEGKCPICRRALDDPAVNCTEERCISV